MRYMPYIEVRAYPRDEEIKRRTAERIKQVIQEEYGCPGNVISISFEDFSPDDWQSEVVDKMIAPKKDRMYILNGEKVR